MLWLIFLPGVLEVFCTYQHTAETEADADVAGSSSGHERPLWTDVTEAKAASLHLYNNKLSMISQHQHKTNNERGFGRDDVDVATWTQSQSVEKGYASGISEWKCECEARELLDFLFFFLFRGRRVGCGPARTRKGLTQSLCSGHMAFVISHWEKRLSLGSATTSPSSSHLSLSDFLYVLLLGFKGLKYFSCLLCIKCPHPPSVPKTSQG